MRNEYVQIKKEKELLLMEIYSLNAAVSDMRERDRDSRRSNIQWSASNAQRRHHNLGEACRRRGSRQPGKDDAQSHSLHVIRTVLHLWSFISTPGTKQTLGYPGYKKNPLIAHEVKKK